MSLVRSPTMNSIVWSAMLTDVPSSCTVAQVLRCSGGSGQSTLRR
jgi:hypothetical protein